jgi:OOP family OmpA-OmpF porin
VRPVRPHLFALALSLSAPAAVQAQGWSVSRYVAPPSAEDLNATERALVTPHLRVGGLVAVDWARSLAGVPIEQRVTAHLAATVGLFDRVQLGVVMPVVLTQELAMMGSSLAPGDLRVDARVRVLGPARRGSGRLALAATLLLPTGRGGAYAGDGAVGVVPRLIFELTNARDFVFAANLGLAVRPGWENQILARAGVTIPLLPRVLVTLEASFKTLLRDPLAGGALSLEALGGVHHVGRSGLAVGVAAGPRLLDGEGSADVRVLGLVGYAPQVAEPAVVVSDRDHDAVPDADDLCPEVPAGRRPDSRRRGCPFVERVVPEAPPVVVAPPPPPDPDRDRDGIANDDDRCPDDAGPASSDPATHGCPRVYVTADRVVITQQPRFAVDRAVILPESAPLLMEVAAVLEAHPELARIEVQGHTDDRAGDEHNQVLSRRRAESICDWLVGRGIARSRLVARGYGRTRPLVDNATPAGRAMNRRVEFVVLERTPPATR